MKIVWETDETLGTVHLPSPLIVSNKQDFLAYIEFYDGLTLLKKFDMADSMLLLEARVLKGSKVFHDQDHPSWNFNQAKKGLVTKYFRRADFPVGFYSAQIFFSPTNSKMMYSSSPFCIDVRDDDTETPEQIKLKNLLARNNSAQEKA